MYNDSKKYKYGRQERRKGKIVQRVVHKIL